MELPPGWDGYDAPPPTNRAAALALTVQEIMKVEGLHGADVVPDADGGLAFCFFRGEKYADIECLNDGDIFSAISDGQGFREVIHVKDAKGDLQKAVRRISDFLNA